MIGRKLGRMLGRTRSSSNRNAIPARPRARKRHGVLDFLPLGLIAIALAIRVWSDHRRSTAHQHKLNLAVTVSSDQQRRFERRYAGQTQTLLAIAVDPSFRPETDGSIEGPWWKGEATDIEYKPYQDQAWQSVPMGAFASAWSNGAFQGAVRVSYSKTGYWRVTIRGSVRYERPDSNEEWSGEFVKQIEEQVLPPDMLPRPPDNIPNNAVVLEKNKTYIRKIQWNPNGGGSWKDVPMPGQPGYPLAIEQHSVLGFRIVKMYPKQPWPNYPEFYPYWEKGKDKTMFYGDEVWTGFPAISKNAKDLYPITAYCGKPFTVYVRVTPEKPNSPFVKEY